MRFDVQSGTLTLEAEIMADHGMIKGYVEPHISDVIVRGRDDFEKGFFNKVWERVVAMTLLGIGKGKENEVSLRVPLTGRLDTLHVSVGTMIPGIINRLFARYLPMFRFWLPQ